MFTRIEDLHTTLMDVSQEAYGVAVYIRVNTVIEVYQTSTG